MIPIAIVLGLIMGLFPRYRVWSIPVIGAVWAILLSNAGDSTLSALQIWTGGFALGAINSAVGVGLSWLIAEAGRGLSGRSHRDEATR